ncbi:MAG: MFS transporter, partial [Chlamydiia bacterium]|nr:MFS transporter [Chlamydiia bacterium]
MYEALKLVVSPLLAITLLALGDGYFTTFVSVRLSLEGWSEVSIGCVQSAYFLGQCIGAWRNKRLILRVGFIRSLCVFASILAASVLIQAQGPHIIVLALLRFIGGVSIVGIYIIGESWILRMSSHTTRGVILSLYMIFYYGAFVISQSIFDHIDVRSLSPYLFTATMVSLCSLPVALTRVTSPDFGTPPRLSVKELMKGSTLGFFGCGLAGMLLAAVYAFMPIFAHESGYSVSKIMVSTIGGGVL